MEKKILVTPARREQFAAPNFRRLADEDYLVKRNHFVQLSIFDSVIALLLLNHDQNDSATSEKSQENLQKKHNYDIINVNRLLAASHNKGMHPILSFNNSYSF